MTREDVEGFEKEFLEYARGFLSEEKDYSRNIQLKITHTLMVRRESRAIAEAEGWPAADVALAEVIGLGHDYGRFEQFKTYRTFADAHSLDHGDLSAKLLAEHNRLHFLNAADQAIVWTAIRNHNKRVLPAGLSERELRFARIIRDADKMDIMRVLMDYYAHNKDNEAVTMGLKNIPEVTPEVVRLLHARQSPRYTDLRTIPDFVMTTLSWAYDLNYPFSCREYVRRGLLEAMFPYIADIPEAVVIYREVLDYLRQF